MAYVEVLIAAAGALLLALGADLVMGRRGLVAALLVSGTGAACGWFLAVRVFGVASTAQWGWLAWAMAGSVLALAAFYIFRNTR